MNLFAKPTEGKPAGLFSVGHFILLFLTITGVIIAIHFTKNRDKEAVKKTIKRCTIFLWILEIIKIIFNLVIGNSKNINTYIPLYFCSLTLYAGLFSSFAKGKLKKIGDVFLATGGIVAGIVFIIFPTTSLLTYPIFHYITMQSFIFHGAMIYLGIIINKYKYIEIEKKDILYYAGLILVICIIAYIINSIFDSNLMFISKDFPGTPLTILESMAMGISVITTDVGVAREALGELEKKYIMEERSKECLKNKIKLLFENKKELSAISKENMEQVKKFDWTIVCKQYKDFFENILKQG